MIQTKECPKCGAEHRMHIKKCGCGYQFGQLSKQEEARDPMHGCCEYSTGTSRCHYPGTFSHSSNGGGKWYCSAHDRETDPEMGATIVYKSHDDYPAPDWSIKSVIRRYELRTIKAMAESKHKPATKYQASKPGKDWAKRILERIKDGESLPLIAETMAKETLRLP
jgi:hypothetical protein